MRKFRKSITLLIASIFAVFALAGCTTDAEYDKRQEQSKQSAAKETLEKANLKKKLQLEEDPNRVGYVYLVTFGKPFGYYVIKGKVSNSGSQIDPEDLVNCGSGPSGGGGIQDYCATVDGPQDDGTYGSGDPGIFFFTTDGTMVTTSLDYVYSSQPLPSALDVPKLG